MGDMARENLHLLRARVTAGRMQLIADLRASRGVMPGFALIGFYWSCLFAQMPDLKAHIGLSDGELGTVMLCAVIGGMIAMLGTPVIARVLGRRTGPVAGFAVATGFLILSLADTVPVFAFGLLLGGFGNGLLDVVINDEVSRIEAKTGRALMNLNHGIFSAAYAVGAFSAGTARAGGWAPWEVFGLLFGLAILIIVLMKIDTRAQPKSEAATMRLPGLLILSGGFVVMIAFMGEAASEGWSALFVERQMGGSVAQGAMAPALLGLAMAIGRIGGHFVRLPPLPFMAMGLVLGMLGMGLVSQSTSVSMVLTGFFIAGLGVSFVGPLALAAIGQGVPEAMRLRAMSRGVAMGYGAFFLGPPLMGFISEWFGLAMSFAVMAGLLGLVLLTALPLLARVLRGSGAVQDTARL